LTKSLYVHCAVLCEKSRPVLKSEKLKNVQMGDKSARKTLPGRRVRSLQTYRHYPDFLTRPVAPQGAGPYFYPCKATFIRFRHFFNPLHGKPSRYNPMCISISGWGQSSGLTFFIFSKTGTRLYDGEKNSHPLYATAIVGKDFSSKFAVSSPHRYSMSQESL